MMAALGVGWRPAFTRTCSRRVVCIRFHVPSLRHVRSFLHTVVEARKLMRQGTPLAPCPIQVQNGIDHFSDVGGSWVPAWLGGRDERLEDGPFLLGQIDFSS